MSWASGSGLSMQPSNFFGPRERARERESERARERERERARERERGGAGGREGEREGGDVYVCFHTAEHEDSEQQDEIEHAE
jgi:hypothetical protein